jgi:hypothetical protein
MRHTLLNFLTDFICAIDFYLARMGRRGVPSQIQFDDFIQCVESHENSSHVDAHFDLRASYETDPGRIPIAKEARLRIRPSTIVQASPQLGLREDLESWHKGDLSCKDISGQLIRLGNGV